MKRSVRRAANAREVGKIFLLLILIAWLSTLIYGIWRKEEIARDAVGSTRAELATLEERRDALATEVAELETPRGQEATIRQHQRVARPGEEVIIVVAEEEPLPPPPPTFWERVRGYLPW